jgi:catechol 2,3-dioxygenase-like lactoylglutathione lyase family enzyme
MKLDDVIPWGRSFDEYQRMFALSDRDLAGRILGCGDGPASFNAEATARGHSVVSCDPIYAFSAAEIEKRVNDCYQTVITQVKENLDGFVWSYYRDADDLGAHRLAAMRGFLKDFEQGRREQRYVVGGLPALPFPDRAFSLALVSHLLFLYSDQFSTSAHLASLSELLRVTDEVRVFPLLTLDRTWSPHVEPVQRGLEAAGFAVTIEPVSYEFQKAADHAGNRMMRIFRRHGTLSIEPPSPGSDAMIKGIHHVQITVPQGAEEEARHFYCQALGLAEIRKPESLTGRGGFWVQAGERQIHVGTEEGVVRQATKAHVAYEVTDLDEWKARLAGLGIEVLEGIPIPGYDRFEFRDPFGNRVEFIACLG